MRRKPIKKNEGIFTKGRTFRIVYQGIMIGVLTFIAFIIGIATPEDKLPTIVEYNNQVLTSKEVRVEIGQTMAFIVLAFSELIHVFNIRDNKNSVFKTGILGNGILIGAILVSAGLMGIVLFIPALRQAFSIPILPMSNIVEVILLIIAPLVIVEIMKLLKINTAKEE